MTYSIPNSNKFVESTENNSNITLDAVRKRTSSAIETAVQSGAATLVSAPPGAGKTTAIPEVANDTGLPLTYLTQRTDLYDQMETLCGNMGISPVKIPSPHRDCPTFKGDHGEQWQREVEELYGAGVSGRRIHNEVEPPCHPDCQYIENWRVIDPETTDVFIGHCRHAYIQPVIDERVVVIDEFPGDAFTTHFANPEPIISSFLDQHDLGYSDFTDLLENRSGTDMARSIASNDVPTGRCTKTVLNNPNRETHTLAGPLTFGFAGLIDLGNGFEATRRYEYNDLADAYIPKPYDLWRNTLVKDRVIVRNRASNEMWVLHPPDLSKAAGIVGLDGTPTTMMWDLVFDQQFVHRQVLNAEEMDRYLKEVQGYTIKQAGEGMKSYSSGNYVSLDHDAALTMGVDANYSSSPCLITSKKALNEYEQAGLLKWVDDAMYYGTVKSSNQFAGKEVGIVSGSPHPGDTVIKRWAAMMGHAVEGEGKGVDKTYGPIGDPIYRHFVHNQVLQAILRFGRQGQSATVYVNTLALPDWVTVDSNLDISRFKGEKRRRVVDFLRTHQGEDITQNRIQDECDVTRWTAQKTLREMEGRYVEKHDNAGKNGQHLYAWDS